MRTGYVTWNDFIRPRLGDWSVWNLIMSIDFTYVYKGEKQNVLWDHANHRDIREKYM